MVDDAPDEPTWISYVAAAELAGVAPSTIHLAIQRGEIAHRPAPGRRPSVGRESVLAWTAARTENAETAAERARERALAHAESLPPASGHDWIDTATAAQVLGVSTVRVSQLARADRLPHVRRGRRVWFRRDQLEVVAAARRVRFHGDAPATDAGPAERRRPGAHSGP
ncbi:helix-turn-helix domain-containing protein [Microcystis phage MinS1]|nr:helix-turn-helix domain-containing protein [Microcystis phage MinS1]